MDAIAMAMAISTAMAGDEQPFMDDYSLVDLSKHHQSCKPPTTTTTDRGRHVRGDLTDQTMGLYAIFVRFCGGA